MGGAVRFWWDASTDALVTGLKLRLELGATWAQDLLGGAHRRAGGTGRFGYGHQLSYGYEPGTGGVGMTVQAMTTDLRHALRSLIKSLGFALVFMVTMGLGIGANTAIFSAVNGVLLRPLPHEDGDRLVYLRHSAALVGVDNALFSVPEIEDYRQGSPSLAEVAEFSAMTFTMLGYEGPRLVRAGIVTGNYFEVMGLEARIGRTITSADDGAQSPAVAPLTDEYWRRVFLADPQILGRTVEINGRTITFVGVLEPSPPYPEATDIYVNLSTSPHHLDATMEFDRVHRMTEVFARLAPGATVESATTEIQGISTRLHGEYTEAYQAGAGFSVSVTPLKDQLTERARPILLLLLGTALFVLFIACANLANLTLTRVLRRDHELAIRVSLGGGRWALRRQLLAESLLLSIAGAAVGLLIGWLSIDLFSTFAGRFTSRASEISLDGSVFGLALLIAVAASLVFTWLPGLPSEASVGSALNRAGARTTGGSRAKRAQRALVVAQISTSFVLLIGAGLLVRSMIHLQRVDLGFDSEAVLTMNIPVDFDPAGGGRTADELRDYYLSILDDVRSLPRVAGAALTNAVPLGVDLMGATEIGVEGFEPGSGTPTPRADFRVVTPDFFRTVGVDVLRGREFVSTDLEDAQLVVIINESMAEAYFPDRDPIGGQIAWTDDLLTRFMGLSQDWRTVVGVVADTRDNLFDEGGAHAMYSPYRQVGMSGSLVVRGTGDASALVSSIREVILARDPNQPIDNVATIAELERESVAPRRLNAMLLTSFAVLALLIAAVGIGGVLAFSVGSRIREFGIRGALGAAPVQVWSGVVAEGAVLAGIGVAVGGVLALGLSRFMGGFLVGVPAIDPVTYFLVGTILIVVSMGAAWVPAWRAARVSPLEALSAD
jgi:predicted permease